MSHILVVLETQSSNAFEKSQTTCTRLRQRAAGGDATEIYEFIPHGAHAHSVENARAAAGK